MYECRRNVESRISESQCFVCHPPPSALKLLDTVLVIRSMHRRPTAPATLGHPRPGLILRVHSLVLMLVVTCDTVVASGRWCGAIRRRSRGQARRDDHFHSIRAGFLLLIIRAMWRPSGRVCSSLIMNITWMLWHWPEGQWWMRGLIARSGIRWIQQVTVTIDCRVKKVAVGVRSSIVRPRLQGSIFFVVEGGSLALLFLPA
mmetsp:Transcript_53/g.206  ORF Transcript_53/g.206 Transcript_53/m.206 type:complete len:202 (-) Transcript_53:923-1528(-)